MVLCPYAVITISFWIRYNCIAISLGLERTTAVSICTLPVLPFIVAGIIARDDFYRYFY